MRCLGLFHQNCTRDRLLHVLLAALLWALHLYVWPALLFYPSCSDPVLILHSVTAQDRYFMSIWFFMFFLPIEEAWSVDSWLGNLLIHPQKARNFSNLVEEIKHWRAGSTGLLLPCSFYPSYLIATRLPLLSRLVKNGPKLVRSSTYLSLPYLILDDAAFYALANHSPLPLGVFVFENVPMRVLQLLTAATYFLERYAFLLLFIPYKYVLL